MTASPSGPTFKSAEVKLSCQQYPQDFSIMPSNSVQSRSLCWHCGVHCSSHKFQVSQSRAAGHMQCLTLCWTCSTSLFQTVLKFPHSESKDGKGSKKGHTSSFLLLFAKAALLGLPRTTSTCTCTLLLWSASTVRRYLTANTCMKSCAPKGLLPPALVRVKQTCPLTRAALFEVQSWSTESAWIDRRFWELTPLWLA